MLDTADGQTWASMLLGADGFRSTSRWVTSFFHNVPLACGIPSLLRDVFGYFGRGGLTTVMNG